MIDLPVYNLTTASSTYVAGGFLVHNCGTPVIVTDFSAMAEFCGIGWRVPPLRLERTLLGANQALADVNGTYHALAEAFRRPRSDHWAAIGHDFVKQWDWPIVLEKYWRPFVEEMDAGRLALAGELRSHCQPAVNSVPLP